VTAPTWRERLKPLELVAMAGVLGVFAGVIALVGSRSIEVAAILAGIAFIAALLVLAMLALAAGAPAEGDQDRPVLLDRVEPPEAPAAPEAKD
jgi:hypothetical protein